MLNLFYSLTRLQQVGLIALTTAVFFVFLSYISALIPPFIIAIFFSYLLNPVVDRIEFFSQKRILAVILLYIGILIGIIFFFNYFIPLLVLEFNDLTTRLPFYINKLKEWGEIIRFNIEKTIPFVQRINVLDTLQSQFQQVIFELAQRIPTFFLSTFSTLSYALLIPVILFFFLLEGPDFKKSLFRLIPNKYFELLMYLFYSIGDKLGNYLRGIFIETLIVAILTLGLLFSLGVDYAILLSTIAGVMNVIPYLGPVLGAIPALIIIYLKFKSFQLLLYLIIGFVVIQSLDNIILKPLIYSQSVNLHPLAILVCLLIGGMIAGVWGLILAVPVAGILKVTISIISKEVQFRLRMADTLDTPT